MNKVLMIAVTASIGMTFAPHGMSAMEELELTCIHDFIPKDNYMNDELNQPDVPLRSKNALAEFQGFISRHGWTHTSQGLLEGPPGRLPRAHSTPRTSLNRSSPQNGDRGLHSTELAPRSMESHAPRVALPQHWHKS